MDAHDDGRPPGLLLVLYASETGNAQDVAERIAREARAHLARQRQQRNPLLFSAALAAPLDAIPLSAWPRAAAVALVVSTTGQGEAPQNMRATWRRLLRRSLPPDALSEVKYALFGLGDSGYVDFCAAALRLDRRLAGLGASALCARALGDDRAPGGGHEAALDPWLARELWPALGCGGGDGGVGAASALPPPRFRASVLPPTTAAATAAQTDDLLSPEEREHAEAAEAAAAFRAMIAAGEARAAAAALAGGAAPAAATPPAATPSFPHGPWKPLMARLVANRRLTSPDHFQDTRHFEFDLTGYDGRGGGAGAAAGPAANGDDEKSSSSPLPLYEPGDVLAIFPRQPREDVDAVLRACGFSGDERLRIEEEEEGAGAESGNDSTTTPTAPPHMEASARAVVAGVLDVSSASPRRHVWEVLAAHAREVAEATPAASVELVRQRADRLALFASAAGREDAARYAWGSERRALAEVLRDFFLDAATEADAAATAAAAPPPPRLSLARLLESCPRLRPRLFSLASSPLAHGRHAAHVLAAVVAWRSPSRRPVRGLATGWLASLLGGETATATLKPPRVPVWIEKAETLRPPTDPSVPLLLIGPGTGVAPFRAILQERAAALAAAAASGGGASFAPCHLFFGCRSQEADFYYRDEWHRLVEAGVLARDGGLVTAFSRPEGGGAGGGGEATAAAAAAATTAATTTAAPAGGRVYVTHRLREHADLVWDLVEHKGAHVLVSGSAARMPADVADALADVAAARLPPPPTAEGAPATAAGRRAAGRAWVKALEARGRFRVEAWS